MKTNEPYLRDLLLIGGGHAHVQVIRRFGMKPEPGVRVTLISRESESPYTGMLPGFIAGEYERRDMVIDLLKLARFAQSRFIEGDVEYVDLSEQRVHLSGDRVPIRFDVLSLNTGGDCTLPIPGGNLIEPVKPIGRFLKRWPNTLEHLTRLTDARIVVIGGGPGSVELVLALRQRLGSECQITLVTRAPELVLDHGDGVREDVYDALHNNAIELELGFEVVSAKRGSPHDFIELRNQDGSVIACAHAFSATGVMAPDWIHRSGFSVDDEGFIAVNRYLQAQTAPNVFGAGDIVSLVDQPRPKSGVYAVKAGPFLAENLVRHVTGMKLKRFKAQRRALALLRLAPGKAVASRGLLQASGHWLWRYKDRIDRRFMRRFQVLPAMSTPSFQYQGSLRTDAPEATMRCGGCGAKLGADVLQRVLQRLDIPVDENVQLGIGEDAAVVNFGSAVLAMSCDGFRAMIDDPWRFGRIAAHHALNDLYAMNSEPQIAMALVTVPFMASELMEEDLFQLMSGALTVFKEDGVSLVGGHSAEGTELGVGFSVVGTTGFSIMTKSNLQPGQTLVLTKPLGVGAILAGGMDGRCDATAVEQALHTMDQSNASAVRLFADYAVTACTDVTGFGLAGHLGEMLRASHASASLNLRDIPVLSTALDALATGVESSLQANNERVLQDCVYDCSSLDLRLRMLADPQTSGGLLAGVETDYAQACVNELRALGYPYAQTIGDVDEAPKRAGRIAVRS